MDVEKERFIDDDEQSEEETPALILRSICKSVLILGVVVFSSFSFFLFNKSNDSPKGTPLDKMSSFSGKKPFPTDLVGANGVYNTSDFKNEKSNVVPYWESVLFQLEENAKRIDNETSTKINSLTHWGPCYQPLPSKRGIDWQKLIKRNAERKSDDQISYPVANYRTNDNVLSNLCRPGFLIIGAGKCGTSSLYHYLVGHPRVLPAEEKQIHYFKYHIDKPMRWYLSNFPSTKTFLASGALMTGEASPGYMPYPDVAHRISRWMKIYAGNGKETYSQHWNSTPKIIAIVRDPLERAWSSYKYNYRTPALSKLRKGRGGVARHKSDNYYIKNHIFSFEDMITAELKQLRKCLKPNGPSETMTREMFHKKSWASLEFERRENEGLPNLIDLDETCYGDRVSSSVPREQWEELVEKQPQRIIDVPNLHLVQSFIGRSLYALPLEWWYAVFQKKDIYIFCNEDLRDRPSDSMSELTEFLGLPSFNFSDVVNAGMYNVGGHRGYDFLTPWNATDNDTKVSSREEIPISDKLKDEFLSFVEPYNERLFNLTGRKCNW